jgi:lipopolysaccharide exporter
MAKPCPMVMSPSVIDSSQDSKEKSNFAEDVLKLVSGTGSAQLLGVLGAFFTTRFFAPSAFGVAALFASIVSLIIMVVCMRYELSIMLPAKDEEAVNVVAVSFSFLVLISAVTAVLVWASGGLLPHLLKAPELSRYLWLLPISLFFGGLLAILNRWNSRKKRFTWLTVTQVLGAVCTLGAQVTLGLMGRVTGGYLITAAVFGLAVSTSMLAIVTWRDHSKLFLENARVEQILAAVKRYSRFPKYSTGKALLDAVAWQLPVWFLSGAFSTAVVGQYALGTKLLHMPMSLVGNNVAIVFFQRAAKARHQGTLTEVVEKTFSYLVTYCFFPCLMLSLVGKDLFLVAFGPRWAEAGVYTQILSVWLCVWFASSPLGIVLDVLEQQPQHLGLSLLSLVTRLAALSIGMMTRNPRLMIALFASSAVLVYGYYCFSILRSARVPARRVLPVVINSLIRLIPAAVLIIALKAFGAPSILVVAAAVLLVLLYYIHVLRTDAIVREFVSAKFQKPKAEAAETQRSEARAFGVKSA